MGDPLDMLVEECSEVIKAVMKARRFGFTGAPGYTGIKPFEEIVKEVGDVLACIDLLCAGYTKPQFALGDFLEAKEIKLAKLTAYFRQSKEA